MVRLQRFKRGAAAGEGNLEQRTEPEDPTDVVDGDDGDGTPPDDDPESDSALLESPEPDVPEATDALTTDEAHEEAPDDEPGAVPGGLASAAALLRASHPRQAVGMAVAVALVALVSDRPLREAALVFGTVLVGGAILGWHNDLVDRERDAVHQTPRKPIAEGRLDPGTVWFALVVAALLVIPLSITTGVTAGVFYLVSLMVGIVGNVVLRRGFFSWATWAASFALLTAYLSYGGADSQAEGAAPEPLMVVLAALLGVGVHLARSVWGLVPDDADGWTSLPLRLGRKYGATKLLAISAGYIVLVALLIVIAASTVGLRS